MNNRTTASMLLSSVIAVLLLSAAVVQIALAAPELACLPGTRHTLRGVGPPNTALLILFDGRSVGGGTSDAAGAYQLSLVIGQEAPGVYPVAVAVRATYAEIASATCIVPDPDAPTGPAVSKDAPTSPAETPAAPGSSAVPTRSSTVNSTTSSTVSSTTTRIASTPSLSPSISPSISATPSTSPSTSTTPSPSLSPSISATPGTPSPSLTASLTATRTSTTSGNSAASATPSLTRTSSPTSTTGTGGSAEIEVYEIEDPPVQEELPLEGNVFYTEGDGIAGVSVTVTYSVDGVDKGTWCPSLTTDAFGDWECTKDLASDLLGKQVTITVSATVNGQKISATTSFRPVDADS